MFEQISRVGGQRDFDFESLKGAWTLPSGMLDMFKICDWASV